MRAGRTTAYPSIQGGGGDTSPSSRTKVQHFCPGCGVPAKLKGPQDDEEIDQYTASNADIAIKSLKKKRKILEIKPGEEVAMLQRPVTDYSERLQNIHGTSGLAETASRFYPRPWVKPFAEMCCTVGRASGVRWFSDVGDRFVALVTVA